jgi:hypothetical protein
MSMPSTPLQIMARRINRLAELLPKGHECEPIFAEFDALGEYVRHLEDRVAQIDIPTDWSAMARAMLRLDQGWELWDDHGTWRWYRETKPGFDEDLPTEAEVAFLLIVREMSEGS